MRDGASRQERHVLSAADRAPARTI